MSVTMQDEALSILTVDQDSRHQQPRMTEISTQVLSVRDHLTCKEAIDFWHRYFSEHTNSDVHVDAFLEACQAEFSTNVFKRAFDDALPCDAAVNEEDVMADFYHTL